MTGETECTVAHGIILEIQRVIGRKSRFSYKLLPRDGLRSGKMFVRPSVTLSVRHTTIFSLLLLVCVSFTIIGQPRNSAPIRRVQPRQATIQFRQRTGFDNVRHRLGLATRTQTSVRKSPFPSAGTAASPVRAKTVQQRPLLPREVETWLPDCGVTH